MSADGGTVLWAKHDYDREAALDQWATGATAGTIATAFGVPLTTIRSLVAYAKERRDVRVAASHRIGAPPQWEPAQVDELRRLWATGISSAAIAREMGLPSRNAVLGKAHRLKLPARNPSAHRTYVPNPATSKMRPLTKKRVANPKSADNKIKVQLQPASIPLYQPTNNPIPFGLIANGGCHYVVGPVSGPDTLMCAAPVKRRSLCKFHLNLCWYRRAKNGEMSEAS